MKALLISSILAITLCSSTSVFARERAQPIDQESMTNEESSESSVNSTPDSEQSGIRRALPIDQESVTSEGSSGSPVKPTPDSEKTIIKGTVRSVDIKRNIVVIVSDSDQEYRIPIDKHGPFPSVGEKWILDAGCKRYADGSAECWIHIYKSASL